jgi:hypothetical protein
MARRKALYINMFGFDTLIKDLLPFKEAVVGNLAINLLGIVNL